MIQLIIYTPFISVKYTAPGPSCTRSKKQNCLTMISILLTWSWGRLLVSRSGFKINFKKKFKALNHVLSCVASLSLQMMFCRPFAIFQASFQIQPSRLWNCRSFSIQALINQGQSLSHGLRWTGMRSEIQCLCLLLRLYCVFNCTHMTWLICRPNFLSGIADDKLREWAEKIHGLWKSLGRKVMSSKLTQL